MELIGLYLIAAGLLVVAGIAKAIRPDDTARAVAAVWPGRRTPSVRAASPDHPGRRVAEATVGVVALAFPRPLTAALVALSYALFVSAVAYARARGGPLSTCGCFGRADTPATRLHLVIDLMLAGTAAVVAAASSGRGTLALLLAHQPWAGMPLLFVSATGVWLTVLALTALATLEGARQSVRAPATSLAAST